MRVSEIGEFGLIKLLANELGLDYPPVPGKMPEGLLGRPRRRRGRHARRDGAMVWTTDTMVENVHFLPDTPPGRTSAGRRWP